MKSLAISMTALVAFSLAGLAATAVAQTEERPGPEVQSKTLGQVVLQVDGLSCPFCAYGLEKKLTKLEAVDQVEINVKEGRVIVTLKEGTSVSDDAVKKAVKDAGFTVRKIDRSGNRTD